jgi:PTS system cellobiose-specific IIC component
METGTGFFGQMIALLESKLKILAVKISNQRHLMAIRDGLVISMPLTIVGGLSLIVASPPVDPAKMGPTNLIYSFLLAWYNFSVKYANQILTPFNMTMGVMSLFIVIGIAYSLAKSYAMHPLSSGIIGGVVFLMVAAPIQPGVLIQNITPRPNLLNFVQDCIPAYFLSGRGFVTAIIIGLLSVEITRYIAVKKRITIRMPKDVPQAVAESFAALIPIIVNVLIFFTLNLVLTKISGHNLPNAIFKILSPPIKAIDSGWFIALMMIIDQLGWFVGIHDSAIISPIIDPLYRINLLDNAVNKAHHLPLNAILTNPFWSGFIAIGGSGATFGLLFWLLRSKAAQLKEVGKAGLIPGLFNINEPVIFGMPIFLNPIMFIPFIFIPAFNGFFAYYAVRLGFVGRAFVDLPWTTPAIIGAPLSTMDWRAAVLVVLIIVIDVIIYYPFFKMYENSLLAKREQNEISG